MVPIIALNISPRPAGMKKEMNITPVATIRNLTHADTAREMRESIRIQIAEHNTIGTTIHMCDQIQSPFANPACRVNNSKLGTHVTPDRRRPITASFPRT